MLRMKTVTVMVDNDPNANFLFLKIGDTTVSWSSHYECWLLDINAGVKQEFLDSHDVVQALINAVSEQFK